MTLHNVVLQLWEIRFFQCQMSFWQGTHPLCCQGDYVVMEAVDFVIRTLSDSIQVRETCSVVEYYNLD